jgi:hypothetical protein
MSQMTFGDPNSGPRTADIVLSEVHYNPRDFAFLDESFSSGTTGRFQPLLGDWSVSEGRLVVQPQEGVEALSIVPDLGRLPKRFDVGVTIRFTFEPGVRKNGVILFDYQGPEDFKFAQLRVAEGRVVMGRRDAGGWNVLVSTELRITEGTDETLMLEIDGSVASLRRDFLQLFQYDFGEPLNRGTIGLGSRAGQAMFDRILVRSLADEQDQEFVELTNVSDTAVHLDGWKLEGAINYVVPADTVLGPGQSLVVVGFYPEEDERTDNFQQMLAGGSADRLVGPYTGNLSNAGEELLLSRPVAPGDGNSGFVLVDATIYGDETPWPEAADGQGRSLIRRTSSAHGLAASSWMAALPSPDSAFFGPTGDLNRDGRVDADDIGALLMAFADPNSYELTYGVPAALAGDADGDGDLDYDDLDDFARLIQTGSGSAASSEEMASGGGDVAESRQAGESALAVKSVAARRVSKRGR